MIYFYLLVSYFTIQGKFIILIQNLNFMKTFYSIAFSLLSALSTAQQSVSFEDYEGFTTGDINGQGLWISTPTGDIPANVTHQMITQDMASAGNYSLKIVKEPVFGTQTEPIIGGFYNLQTPLDFSNFSVSFDINMSQLDGSVFGFQAMDALGEQYIVRMDFDNTGGIKVLHTLSGIQTLVPASGNWSPDTWYRFKVVGTPAEVKYYLNDVQVFTGTVVNPVNIDQLRFVHDNAVGTAYVDNIKINTELMMAVKDSKPAEKEIQIYPNPSSDVVKIKTLHKIRQVKAIELTGKSVDVRLHENQIKVEDLPAGEYILTIETDAKIFTEKFIKK
ncbi:T9SS C-terminal target domain-containing protein [Chryseobacterium indologenes]|nr:T9SS C-terminal target domain-containing protein [Chryseobacterium indologenes]